VPVGKRNVLVDGPSGSGKTSVAVELERRGYQVVHGDRQLKYRGDPATGEPTPVPEHFADDRARAEWIHGHLCWPLHEVARLVAAQDEAITFFCGGSRNSPLFLHLLDAVFLLDVDQDTLIERLEQRPRDEWAGRGRSEERELVLRLHEEGRGLPPGIPIDARRPLHVVVDDILARCARWVSERPPT
jgi:adenylate kinase family enzyme